MDSNDIGKYKKDIYNLFNCETGKRVLEFLNSAYVETTCMDTITEVTFYRIGQKEFCQGFIKDASTEPSLIELTTETDYDE